jgi:hypothetical protein
MKYNHLRDSEELQTLRSFWIAVSEGNEAPLEKFQNETLRPLIKFQNDFLIQFVESIPHFDSLLNQGSRNEFQIKLGEFIQQASIKYSLIGSVVGLLTNEETTFYLKHQKELNKRIFQMIVQRLSDQLYQ